MVREYDEKSIDSSVGVGAASLSCTEADEAQKFIDIEKLGRQRPAVFASTLAEIAFVTSMLGALAMADFVIGGFQVVLPSLIKPLDIPREVDSWPSSILTLVAGAMLFPFARLADMYGGYVLFNGGLAWFVLWTAFAGFSRNFITLVICRGMQGAGISAFLPAGISVLGRIYRPGPRKNLVFSLYGAIAPIGFGVGLIFGGLAQDLLSWSWFFWIGGIASGLFCIGSLFTVPNDYNEVRKMNVQMDWWGVCTTVPGLLLVVYAITGSSQAGNSWSSPHIISTFVLGILFLCAAVYVEGWIATSPLIPGDIFRVPYIKRMTACLFFSWGVFSIYLCYTNFYIEDILKKPAMTTALWFAPWVIGGVFLAIMSGLILHLVPGSILLLFTGGCKVFAVLLFALMPDNPSYWAWIFPAMVAEAACCDILWTVSNVFLTTSLPRHRQGLAGALISVSLFVGGALFLSIADVAKGQFVNMGMDLKTQYKNVFWLGVGFASVALVICFFIRIGKADSTLTVDEKHSLESKSQTSLSSGPSLRSASISTGPGEEEEKNR